MLQQIITPLVIDVSHHNEVTDWNAVYASGIRAVIHKATQGSTFVDQDYAKRKAAAKAAGLLWGAYHFADSSDVTKQVNSFLSVVGNDEDCLLALDWEELYDAQGRRAKSREMSLAQVKQFLQLVYQRTGQRPILYSGSLIKEVLGGKADPTLSAHRLWMPQYGPRAVLPPGWSSYWLWQYSGDGINGAGIIPGIKTKGIDCNVFGGEDLAQEWGHWPDRAAPAPVPGREDATVADLKGQSRTVDVLLLAKKIGGIGAGISTVAGVASDTAAPPQPVQLPEALFDPVTTVDQMDKIKDSADHTRAFVVSMKGLWSELMPILKSFLELLLTLAQLALMHGWVLGTIVGVVLFILADKLLGWRLEEYVFGRYEPQKRED